MQKSLHIKKATALFVTLMMALSAVGVAYATWFDTVQIEGTIHMGDFLVGILDIKECSDSEPPEKDYSSIECELANPETGVHHIDPETGEPQTVWHTLIVTVNDAYPSIIYLCKFDLKNAGTVPAHIAFVDIIGEKKDSNGTVITGLVWNDPEGDGCGSLWEDWDGSGNVTAGDVEVINLCLIKQETGAPLVCNQLEPCTEEPVDLIIHLKQEAQECHIYQFSVTIWALQWNWPALP
jgi:hypothetical protein